MKFLPVLLVVSLAIFAPQLEGAGESLQQILSDAQTAFIRGDLATAKKNFQIVTQADPKNQVAQNYLRMIRAQEANAPKGNVMEKELSTVVLPKIDFKEATLGSVFDYLRQQVPKVSGGKKSVNFVLQVPEDRLQAQVTLQLTNIPFTEALRYLADLSNLQLEYQTYAIKVTAKGGGPVSTSTPGAAIESVPPTAP
jgi:hypothetical protein